MNDDYDEQISNLGSLNSMNRKLSCTKTKGNKTKLLGNSISLLHRHHKNILYMDLGCYSNGALYNSEIEVLKI